MMMQIKSVRVRMDSMGLKHFILLFGAGLAVVCLAMIIGGAGGPVMNSIAAPQSGKGIPLPMNGQQCFINADGKGTRPVGQCWNGGYTFPSRWIQYFDFRMKIHPFTTAPSSSPLSVNLLWQGRKRGSESFQTIYNGTVSRTVYCPHEPCEDVVWFRTSTVEFESYFIQISEPRSNGQSVNDWFATADMFYRYRNPDFSMFEVGFKAMWMVVSLVVLLAYILRTSFDFQWCGPVEILCLCCKRGTNNPLSFQRQEGTNWVYALLAGVFLFNEPLLWVTYYAPAQIFKLISVAMQLTFIAILAAYWLVEFGLIKANPQAHQQITCCRFYTPKIVAIVIYWLMALAVYGFVLFRMAQDPMYDWSEFSSAPMFLLIWGGLLAALYVLYLGWLILRGITVIRSFKFGEKYVFALHMCLVIATSLGIAAGAVYSVDISDAFSFMLFNALFNTYVYMLAYMYTPLSYQQLGMVELPQGGPMGGPDVEAGHVDAVPTTVSEHGITFTESAPAPLEAYDDFIPGSVKGDEYASRGRTGSDSSVISTSDVVKALSSSDVTATERES